MTLSTRPNSSALCMLSMASAASSFSSYSTNPKPRCFPVAWSSGIDTSLISPKGMNAACSIESFTLSSRPPTYSAVLGLDPLPPVATFVVSIEGGRAAAKTAPARSHGGGYRGRGRWRLPCLLLP